MDTNYPKRWKVTNIEYDTGEYIVFNLPQVVFVYCNEEDIVDCVSEHTGWCIIACEYEEI